MAFGGAILDNEVLPLDVSKVPQALAKRLEICSIQFHRRRLQHADAPDPAGLLSPRHERPRGRRAAEQRDEIAPPHSITSSASDSKLSERFRPSALAVRRLIVVSNLVGCNTGISAGFAPLRTLPA